MIPPEIVIDYMTILVVAATAPATRMPSQQDAETMDLDLLETSLRLAKGEPEPCSV